MTRDELLAKPWMRVVVFAWLILFPVLFIAVPLLKVVTGEGELTMQPLWAFGTWVLGPWALMIVLKYLGGEDKEVR